MAVVLLFCGGYSWYVLAAHRASPNANNIVTEYYFHHDHVIGTSLDVWVTAQREADAEAAEQAIRAEIERLRRIFSLYDANSELSRLNRTRMPMRASPEMIAVLRQYEAWQARAHGALSGQLGELVRLWKGAEATQREPDEAALSQIVQKLRVPGWRIDEPGTVTRLTDQPLNLNAIAKGYIIQKAAAAARSAAPLHGLLLNLGGDMAVWGMDDAGQPGFVVGVQDPHHPEDNAAPLALLRLQDQAVGTSGGYERFVTINGVKHSHIFDPRTGRSAHGAASATVFAANNVTANALATTLCVLAPAEGLRLVAATPGAECLLVTADGTQLRSPGFAKMEIPRSAPAALQGKKDPPAANPWPPGYQVNMTLTLPSGSGKRYRRPYVAVWVENADAKPVRTITVWGNNPRWVKELPQWWRFAKTDNALVRAVSRATRAPGKYSLVWDGKDDRGNALPQGTYTVWVEVHREHGKLVRQTGKLTCAAEPARLTLTKNAETEATLVEYAKKK